MTVPQESPGGSASQLARLRGAATALRAALAAAQPPAAGGAAEAGGGAPADDASWEGRLEEANALVGGAPRTSPRQALEGGEGGEGGGLSPYQAEIVEAASSCPGNCVTFLPLGLGSRAVMDAILVRAVAQHPGKHILLVVDRPSHALSHAQRLRTELGLPTAVFCGGDFLYSFAQQFQASRVLVFTAGLLLRLLKTGVYSLDQSAMLLLVDAFTVVRNHPSNTLVREYWRNAEEGRRPRLVGVLASQLPSKPRPFDRLRQNLRKLCHSLQAQLLLPTGCELALMEAQLHHDSIQLHSYALSTPEERLASLLQQHLLGLWDVLHEFGLNHFGRLVQFASSAAAQGGPGGGGTPGTPATGGYAGTGGASTPPLSRTSPGPGGAAAGGSALTPARPLSAGNSPVTAPEGSPATPLQAGQGQGGTSSAAAAAAEQPDPMQHDWAQVELQVVHSLWHSNALPSKGEHTREPDALALQMHVLDCVRILRVMLEQGPAACLSRLPAALESLASLLEEGPLPFASAVSPLRARILQVAAASPLLPWALQAQEPGGLGLGLLQAGQPARSVSAVEVTLTPPMGMGVPEAPPVAPAGSPASQQEQGEGQDAAASSPAKSPPASSPPPPASPLRGPLRGAALQDGPAAVLAVPPARGSALLELLQELQMGCQLSGQKRKVALVAGGSASVALIQQLVAACKELSSAEVRLLADSLADPPSPAEAEGGEAGDGEADAAAAVAQAVAAVAAAHAHMNGNGKAANGGGLSGGSGDSSLEEGAEAAADDADQADAPANGNGVPAEAAEGEAADAAAGEEVEEEAEEAAEEEEEDLERTPSFTEALVAAAWAQAAPVARVGRLVVHLLTPAEIPLLEMGGRIAGYHSLVWYSSGDVLHAASQELDSAALAACHRLSAALVAATEGEGAAPRRSSRRLECHVLATASQVLALGEVRRVDHSLKAAMELVSLGDAAAEEKLTMLAHRNTAAVLEPEARAVLEMLCCGLCGAAPAFATMTASPSKPPARSRSLPPAPPIAAAMAAAQAAMAGLDGRAAGEDGGDEQAADGGAEGEEGEYALPAGDGAGEEEEEDADGAAPALLFRSSVTLPAAYFPPERFHVAGVSMPLEVFVGPPLLSEEQAANAAALLALAELHRLGIIVRYWPSRLLLAQHLLPRSLAAAVPGASGVPSPGAAAAALAGQQLPMQSSAAIAGEAPLASPPGGMLGMMGGGGMAASSPGGPQGQGQGGPNVMNFFCPLCNVAATGHKAFDAHLRGFRHQRRIKQAQLLQQGQEVSAMLQGLLLEESLKPASADNAAGAGAAGGAGAPAGSPVGAGVLSPSGPAGGLSARVAARPGMAELLDDYAAGEYGSPTFADRQVYSPEPTPFRCEPCGVYCTSQRLLEAHTRGRKHQRRLAGLDSPLARPSSPKAQPLVTPYFCAMCGLYATSEEQLRMHMLGKRHTRMTHLHRQRLLGAAALGGGLDGLHAQPASLQQQQHQLLVAAAAAAALSSGAAAWVPSSSSGLSAGLDPDTSPLPSPALAAAGLAPAGPGGSVAPGYGTSYDGVGSAASPGGDGGAGVALQGLLLDASGNQRIYRCDLCGVVTPSRRHYDYHLQGIKHTRRAMRAQGLDPGSASAPGTPLSCSSPQAPGSRSASPSGRAARPRHSHHGSADWNAPGGAGAGAGSAAGAAGVEPLPESLICSVCGIMATSAINLEDHYKGRRHQKNVERQQAQQAAAAAAAAAATAGSGPMVGLPPRHPSMPSPFAGAAAAKSSVPVPGGLQRSGSSLPRQHSLQRQHSGITLGADGLRLPSGALINAGSLLTANSLQRATSDVYDDFPCVRIGSILLPSSMDLRTFLEDMQQLDGTEGAEADLLPPIAEHHETLGADLAAELGVSPHEEPTEGSLEPDGGDGSALASPAQLFSAAASPTWNYGGGGGGTSGSGPGNSPVGGAGGSAHGAGNVQVAAGAAAVAANGGSSTAPASTAASPAGTARNTPRGYGGSRTQPSSPSVYLPTGQVMVGNGGGGGGLGRLGGRLGSGNMGPRLSRFAQDQQQQQQQQMASMGYGQAYPLPAAAQYSQQYAQHAGYAMPAASMPGMPGYGPSMAHMVPHQHMLAQQAAATYAAGYAAGAGAYARPGSAYDASAAAAMAAQQAAAMQHHQQMAAAYGAALSGGQPTVYAMPGQQGQAYAYAMPGAMPPQPPGRYR